MNISIFSPKNIFLQLRGAINLFEIASVTTITVDGIFFVGCEGIMILEKIDRWDKPQEVKHQEV